MGTQRKQTWPIDWPQLILELRGSGMTTEAIARRLGMALSTVNNWLSGSVSEPSFSQGMDLLLTYREKTGRDIPMLDGSRS